MTAGHELFSYATRAPDGPNDLAAIRIMAALRRKPLMDWQSHVAKVATTRTPDGRYRYRTVILTVPRQAGKTELLTSIELHRSIATRGHLTYSTAQSGLSARRLWREGPLASVDPATAEELGRPPISRRISRTVRNINRTGGAEYVRFKSGSKVGPFTPGASNLDGATTVGLIIVDEAFAFDEQTGSLLMGSIKPTQLVAPNPQLWILSTKGGRKATWLNDWIAKGRASVQDPNSTIAYFESAAPVGSSADDPEALRFHPALETNGGLPGMTIERIWAEREGLTPTEWARGYLNMDSTDTDDLDLNPSELRACIDPALTINPTRMSKTYSFDLARDRTAATIAVAWIDADGTPCAGIVKTAPHIEWVPDSLDWLANHDCDGIIAEPSGPTRSLLADLEAAATIPQLAAINQHDYATACQWFIDALAAKRVRLTPNCADICDQAANVTTADIGGTYVISTRQSTGPIDAVRALALALWHASTHNAPTQIF